MNNILCDVIVYYDINVCNVETLVKNYTRTFDERILSDVCAINYDRRYARVHVPNWGQVQFLPLPTSCRGYRSLIALVPEHMKDDKCVQFDVWPKMYNNFVAYYDQKSFVKE